MHDESVIAREILSLLKKRGDGKSICPSEVARTLAGESDWRSLMEPVRAVARRLARQGAVVITQRGEPVDPDEFKGPIRLRLAQL